MKFRVWHKELNKFLSADEWFIGLDGKLYFLDIQGVSEDYMIECPPELYVIQCFTGLVDKNGKDVYEGDIVRQTDGKFPTFIIEGTVQYDIPNAAFIIQSKNGMCGLGSAETYLEIMGNVFENPKLLS